MEYFKLGVGSGEWGDKGAGEAGEAGETRGQRDKGT
ncbi:hypothetical protein NIES4072_40560 [Nostoc commune NIES-4072]|uniref:Uncharacterized protein n=1 Tax=Nostoc commune NIES-4072 TaxID=2005467 RepID=A0A2R5FQS5_NOSCO|nr:hypothetical protein NIES4070_50290 [Nostoc commune HK-02]GBG20379.1 hypothetical protein NIES4072_40560 [Nostoc commune NIES-4072]